MAYRDDWDDDDDPDDSEWGGWGGWYYKPKPLIKARGGIKAQSKRGAFGESWWAKRWIAVLESFNIGARLGRGRSYARGGQVLSIDIEKGEIEAAVQGSRPKPYEIRIEVKTIPAAGWKQLAKALDREAIFAAKLLAGEMPQETEQVFRDVGLSLFPEKLRDLETSCSCPDWSNPCKHIAAVYYLIGEEFDRDPFLIFKLRGATREELIGMLSAAPGKKDETDIEETELPPDPLATDAAVFWGGGDLADDFFGEVRLPPVSAALPKRLGNFPFWRGGERFLDAIETTYTQASPSGLDIFSLQAEYQRQ
jgi:uncharacterized Zn finger protein